MYVNNESHVDTLLITLPFSKTRKPKSLIMPSKFEPLIPFRKITKPRTLIFSPSFHLPSRSHPPCPSPHPHSADHHIDHDPTPPHRNLTNHQPPPLSASYPSCPFLHILLLLLLLPYHFHPSPLPRGQPCPTRVQCGRDFTCSRYFPYAAAPRSPTASPTAFAGATSAVTTPGPPRAWGVPSARAAVSPPTAAIAPVAVPGRAARARALCRGQLHGVGGPEGLCGPPTLWVVLCHGKVSSQGE